MGLWRHPLEDGAVLIDVGKVEAEAVLHARGGDLQHPGGWVDAFLDRWDIGQRGKVGHQVS